MKVFYALKHEFDRELMDVVCSEDTPCPVKGDPLPLAFTKDKIFDPQSVTQTDLRYPTAELKQKMGLEEGTFIAHFDNEGYLLFIEGKNKTGNPPTHVFLCSNEYLRHLEAEPQKIIRVHLDEERIIYEIQEITWRKTLHLEMNTHQLMNETTEFVYNQLSSEDTGRLIPDSAVIVLPQLQGGFLDYFFAGITSFGHSIFQTFMHPGPETKLPSMNMHFLGNLGTITVEDLRKTIVLVFRNPSKQKDQEESLSAHKKPKKSVEIEEFQPMKAHDPNEMIYWLTAEGYDMLSKVQLSVVKFENNSPLLVLTQLQDYHK